MKKRVLALFLCICLSLSLCACGAGSNPNEGGKNSSAYQNNKNAITQLSRKCYNKYGHYECKGSLIYFFDAQSKQKIVLCNNPNCKHDSDECNAYVYSKAEPENELFISLDSDDNVSIPTDYTSTMFIYAEGDRLYILLTDGTLLSMKYDGTDRKTVAEIGSKYTYGESYKLGREIFIHAFFSVQEKGEIVEKSCFITYNIDTHKWKQGKAFDRVSIDTGRSEGLTYDKTVIYYRPEEPQLIPKGTPLKEAIRIENSAKCEVYSVNIETGERKDIYTGTVGDCSALTMLNGKIYIYSDNKDQLCEMDSKTGEMSVLIDNYPDLVMFGFPVGNCLEIGRTIDQLKDHDEDHHPENHVSEFFNVETKELTKAYEIDSNIEWLKTFRGVYGETEDSYIMTYKMNFNIEYNQSGTPEPQLTEEKIGIISKKDFWNKNYNFEEISW